MNEHNSKVTTMKELISVAQAALDYIDALPSDMVASLHTMPGFDRDWATEVIADAIVESNESRNRYSSSRRQFSCPRPVSLMARATQQKRISPQTMSESYPVSGRPI